jgi:MFS family permease
MGAVREQVREATGAFAKVFRNRELRRINIAFAGSVIGDWAYSIAISVWAYQHGGATAVGVLGVARYVSLALCSPVAASLADRYSKKGVMVASDVIRAGLVALAAALIAADAPRLVVYALALLASVVGTAFRPAQASLLPRLAKDPHELTGANVVASTIESTGFFVGPALAGVLLATTELWVVLMFNTATFVWSAMILLGLHTGSAPVVEATAGDDVKEAAAPEEHSGVLAGFRYISRNRDLRLLAALFTGQTVVAGASLVFEVAIVFDLLEREESTLGLANAVLGVGGLLGGVAAALMARRERMALDFGLGVAFWAAPLLLIVAAPGLGTTLAAMFVIGVANSVVDINAYTIVQRITPDAVMGRVFGALESIVIGGMALGALLMPLLIETIGLRAALAVVGAAVAALVVVSMPRLYGIDTKVLAPPGLRLMRRVPLLAVLPKPTMERLARSLAELHVRAGSTVMREGDRGDRYWMINKGRVLVTVAGEKMRELGPGDGFGEIALLREVPRTATVTALDDVELFGLDRDDFIPAVTGSTESAELAEGVVNRYLGFA